MAKPNEILKFTIPSGTVKTNDVLIHFQDNQAQIAEIEIDYVIYPPATTTTVITKTASHAGNFLIFFSRQIFIV